METEKHHERQVLKLTINHKEFEWKEQYITGWEIRKLGNIPPDDDLFLAIKKPFEDELIKDDTRVDLARPGIEHFYSKPKHHHFTIIVNGEPHHVKNDEVTYNEVVTMAFPDYPQHPERTYSVKYKKGPSSNPEGILAPSGKVKIKNDMVFTAKHTGQS